jgi:hypothetical protein
MKTFTYKGKQFTKAGTFKKTYGIKDIFKHKPSQILWCNKIMDIDYDEFYSFGNKDTDVFRMDDGTLVVPTTNCLIEFKP